MKSKDIICEMQEQHDAFERSFSALGTRTGLGEGTEQQRARSLYLTTISFGTGQGEQLPAVAGLVEHLLSTCSQPRVLRVGESPCRRGQQGCWGFSKCQSSSKPGNAMKLPVPGNSVVPWSSTDWSQAGTNNVRVNTFKNCIEMV